MRLLVLGASGMLGNTLFRYFAADRRHECYGTLRSGRADPGLESLPPERIIEGVSAESFDSVIRAVSLARPDTIINCVGIVKQLSSSQDPATAISINALFPHRLAHLAAASHARLIQISTDCVFSGSSGHYRETDPPDAQDLYGRTKLLGELSYPHTITLRTSIIGHEVASARSLLNWFLNQSGQIHGYRRAFFSGLPTVELARVIADYVLPHPNLSGLYHVAASRISKYDLLEEVREIYGHTVEIIPDDRIVTDRSLVADRFSAETGYSAPNWKDLIIRMRDFG